MKHLMKYLSTPLAFVMAFALFGMPSGLATDHLPTVGGYACADGDMCYGGYGNDGTGCTNQTNQNSHQSCQQAEAATIALTTFATIWGATGLWMSVIPGGQLPGMALGVAAVLLGVAAFTIGVVYSDC